MNQPYTNIRSYPTERSNNLRKLFRGYHPAVTEARAKIDGSDVVVSLPDGTDTVISGRWLRDHGDDPESIDPLSRQRIVDTFSIPPDVAPVDLAQTPDRMTISWSDGGETGHALADLRTTARRRRRPAPTTGLPLTVDTELALWSSPPEATLFPTAALDDDDLWRGALAHLHHHGWVMFDGVELGMESTKRVANRFGYVRHTVFGGIWTLSPTWRRFG